MAIETGKFISEHLSKYILKFTSANERNGIARSEGRSSELGRLICIRDRKVTKKNKSLLTAILKLAIKNRNIENPALRKAHKEVLEITKN